MRDASVDPTYQLGKLQTEDDPDLNTTRTKALHVVANICKEQGHGRQELREVVLALGLESALTQDQRKILSIPND